MELLLVVPSLHLMSLVTYYDAQVYIMYVYIGAI